MRHDLYVGCLTHAGAHKTSKQANFDLADDDDSERKTSNWIFSAFCDGSFFFP